MDEYMKNYFEMILLQTPKRFMDKNGYINELYLQPERSKREDSYFVEFGCNSPVRFNTSKGIKIMEPGKNYDENLNEI